MQLNLFQWDRIEVGNGHACLARLAFDQARDHFVRVLRGAPGQVAAQSGLEAVDYWERALLALADRQGEAAVAYFWAQVRAFSFGSREVDHQLRANLLGRLYAMMEQGGVDYLPPDLCRGYLSLQLGEYVTAENQLRALIASVPGEGLLYGYLGDALWRQGRREIANGVYAVALLLDPKGMAAYETSNPQLTEIIAAYGADRAPVYGYFRGVLPLVEQENAPDTEWRRIYGQLRRVERARHRQDHATSIAARRDLLESAPAVFNDYLAFLQLNGTGGRETRTMGKAVAGGGGLHARPVQRVRGD